MSLPHEQVRSVAAMKAALLRICEPGRMSKREIRRLAFAAIKHCPSQHELTRAFAALLRQDNRLQELEWLEQEAERRERGR